MKRVLYKEKLSELSDKGSIRFTCMVFTKDSSSVVVAVGECDINTEGAFVSFQNCRDSAFYSC